MRPTPVPSIVCRLLLVFLVAIPAILLLFPVLFFTFRNIANAEMACYVQSIEKGFIPGYTRTDLPLEDAQRKRFAECIGNTDDASVDVSLDGLRNTFWD